MATLLVTTGLLGANRIEVTGTMIIGRANADIALDDTEVSRRHASVQPVEPSGIQIMDLGSLNGTWVNGNRIDGTVILKPGDVIKVGKSSLELEGRRDPDLTTVSQTTSTPGRAVEVPPAAERQTKVEKVAHAEEEHAFEQPLPASAEVARPGAGVPLAAPAAPGLAQAPGKPFTVHGAETRPSRRRVASRQQVPMVLAFSVIVITGVVLVLYFYLKFMG